MTTINAIRGIVNGSASANLLDLQNYPWTGTALKVTHLLASTGLTLATMGNSIDAIGLAIPIASALTPIALLFDAKNIAPFSANTEKYLNAAYQTGIVVNCIAMVVLGNPVFALASLSMLALNAIADGQVKNIFDRFKKVCAGIFLTNWYIIQATLLHGPLATVAQFGIASVAARALLNFVEAEPKEIQEKKVVQKETQEVTIIQKENQEQIIVQKEKTVEKVTVEKVSVVEEPRVEPQDPWYFRPMFRQ